MRKTISTLSALILMLGFAGAANALTFGPGDFPADNTTNNILLPGGSITGSSNFGVRTLGTITGIGIVGGNESKELDGLNEWIQIVFDEPQIITELVIGFLYPSDGGTGAIYSDKVNERALIDINNNGTPFTLQATGPTTATWSGSGGVSNLEQAVQNFGGAWTLTNPFGTTTVTSIMFTAPNEFQVPGFANSDFALVSLATAEVPLPAAAWLLGSGLLGLMGLKRRRIRS